MKITRKQLRKLVLNETQKALGLKQDMSLRDVGVDHQIIDKVREVYEMFGSSGGEYGRYNLPPDGLMIKRILINRIINLGRLMNPTDYNYSKVESDIALHRQRRLSAALDLFGGRDGRFTSSSSPYSSEKRADKYEYEWLELYQEILGGTVEWDDQKGWVRK